MSARPSRTASNVPGGAATLLGRMLHFMRPALSFSSMSHQFFCTVLRVCVGGSQLETVNTVWADASPLVNTVVERVCGVHRMVRFNIGEDPGAPTPDLPELVDRMVG